MKHLFALAIIGSVSLTSAANASPLSDCYDLVIDSCNKGSHPVPCASNGMDQCDEVHTAVIMTTPKFKLKQTRKSAEMAVIAIQPAKKPARK
ncbi:MAG: hypothetical protein ACSHYC_05035 [Alphaproteobacteria bacterium]